MSPEAEQDARRAWVGQSWAFRHAVECEAARRFEQLSARLEARGAPPALVALARAAALDEQAHALLCAERARASGREPDPPDDGPLRPLAPSRLGERERLLYEVVACCCVTETESMGVLTTLLAGELEPAVRQVLHRLARDEVQHSRLGWAHLSWEAGQGPVDFLGPLLPDMLQGNAGPELFAPAPPERQDPGLQAQGVLPHARKREVFAQVLQQVVFPGLQQLGVSPGAGQRWLDQQLASAPDRPRR